MGALALTSKAAYREPFEPLPGDVTFVPYGDADALAAAVDRRDRRRRPRAAPGRGRRRRAAARTTSPRRARSPASTARCSGSTRSRPASAAPAPGSPTRTPTSPTRWTRRRHRHAGQGARRRLPDRRLPRLRRRRPTCSSPGNHGTTFGGNPVACGGRPRRDRHHRARRAARPRHRRRRAAARRPGRRRPRHRGARRRPADRARPDRGRAAEVVAAALDAGFIVNARPPTGPPGAAAGPHRPTQADSFLAAWPGILDAAYAGGTSRDPPLPARRRPRPRRAGRGARPGRQAQGRAVRRAAARRPRTVAVLFDKPTLRTQASFASGIAELGGFPMIIDGIARPGRRRASPIADTARVLGRQASADRVAHPRAGPARGDGGRTPAYPWSTR